MDRFEEEFTRLVTPALTTSDQSIPILLSLHRLPTRRVCAGVGFDDIKAGTLVVRKLLRLKDAPLRAGLDRVMHLIQPAGGA
ncbi:hypothetical protein KCP76_18670 [Salmonella enterica subsp. enterica serovar Weltevreden]|nr:hypothetical protein KCP76_18670 [Salmonella enterica subsp. enterica serovar Weltevreden]